MEETSQRRKPTVKRIILKKKPSFYKDLLFSNLLTKDYPLGVLLDKQNRVQAVRMDTKHYAKVLKELKAHHYV